MQSPFTGQYFSMTTFCIAFYKSYLTGMLEELNEKFAFHLDTCPCTDRTGHSAADSETESEIAIALAGSSHSSRLSGPLADTYLKVVDVSVPG